MTQGRWWTLVALVALAVSGVRAGETETKGKGSSSGSRQTTGTLTGKTYSVKTLAHTLGQDGADRLISAITHAVKPSSWSKNGGDGTIEYCPSEKVLIVKHQTSEAHRQISSILKALAKMPPSQACPVAHAAYACADAPVATPAPAYPAPAEHHKQYGHFVLDNVNLNAMGVSCAIKRIRFMYKGDGIDNEVAKCALTNGESEKKTDVPKVLTDLLEKLEKSEGSKKPCCSGCAPTCTHASSGCCTTTLPTGGVSGACIGNASGACVGACVGPTCPKAGTAGFVATPPVEPKSSAPEYKADKGANKP
jgi:hypothetical protein